MTNEEELETYESGKGLDVEPGLYPGTVVEVEPVDGTFGKQWRFAFSLDEYPDERPWAWASAKLGTKTKLFGWVGVLLGRPLEIGERIAPSDLVGLRCRVLIVESHSDSDGEPRRVVGNILREKAAAPVPAVADPDSPPEDQPAPLGQVNLVSNRLNLVPQEVALALCEKYGVEVAYDEDGAKLYITDASKLTGGAKGTAEQLIAELNAAKKAAKEPA